ARWHPRTRRGHYSRPGRHRDPHRASLRPAADAAFRRSRDGAGFAGAVQHHGGDRRACDRAAQSEGGVHLMAELRDLYQEVILEHSKRPRNYRTLEAANRTAEAYNPLCGDHFTIYLDVGEGHIRDIAFQGSGCAISKASASMMTQAVKGKRTDEAEELF